MTSFSLRTHFLMEPVIGLILVVVLTSTYIWSVEKNNSVMTQLVKYDLKLLDQYTDLFTELSQNHMELYKLLYDAPNTEEGILYDRGQVVLDSILASSDTIMELSEKNPKPNHLHLLNEQQLQTTKQLLNIYRSRTMSAIEITTVSLTHASSYLLKANEAFAIMHHHFAEMLDMARLEISNKTQKHVAVNQSNTRLIAAIGLSVSFILLLVAYLTSLRVSTRLQRQVSKLDRLSLSGSYPSIKTGQDEIDKISTAISAFENSLEKIRQQDKKLVLKNKDLLNEIEIRSMTEDVLLQARDELEEKVQLRTQSLSTANKALSEENRQRIQAEQRMTIYKQVIQSTDEVIMITDKNSLIIEVNPAYEKKLGYSRAEVIGNTPALTSSKLHDKDFFEAMWISLKEHHHWTGEIWNKSKNGEIIPFWLTINAILDDNGEVTHYIGLSRDVSELKQAEDDLEQLAYYDPLTNLPNRSLFNDRLEQMIINAKRHNYHLAVMYVDLDRFKDVNDSFGHSFGDALLIQVAGRLRAQLREGDTVSRMGGDEFTIILPELKAPQEVNKIADKLIQSISEPFNIVDHEIAIGCSIGIALFPEHGVDAERLKKNSDIAMYRAKELGRNRYHLYDDTLQKDNIARLKMVTDIRIALANHEFTLVYQPIVDLRTNEVHEVEALIRWQRINGDWISPADFIPLAEEYNLITDIDILVLNTACQFAAQRSDNLIIHVNLSASLFEDISTPQLVKDCLKNSGLPANQLCLEITETAVIGDPKAAKKILEKIKKLGVMVALDDFGTGYSSLTHLTSFPLERIKIDQSFIAPLLNDNTSRKVVGAMIDLAQNMGLKAVAEGIEDIDQHNALIKMGCDYGQGYYYARPLSGEDFNNWSLHLPKQTVLKSI